MASQGRLSFFKNKGRNEDLLRECRRDVSVELRKQKREEFLTKRRSIQDSDPISPEQTKNTGDFEKIIRDISSSDTQVQILAVRHARRMLSHGEDLPIEKFIRANLIPTLVNLLKHDNDTLQYEAAWALTNIAAGTSEQTAEVVAAGAVPYLIALISSNNEDLTEQAVWALGNIAGDGVLLRDYVTKCGIVPPLLKLVKPDIPNKLLGKVTWTLANLCRDRVPPHDFTVVNQCIPVFTELLQHSYVEVVIDSCLALSYITNGFHYQIEKVIRAGAVPHLVQLLHRTEVSIVSAALHAIGNIVIGRDSEVQFVIDAGALPALKELLRHKKRLVIKESAWVMSNIVAGNTTQIQQVVDVGIVPAIIDVLVTGDFPSQKEAIWVVSNITASGTVEQINGLVDSGILPPLCYLLSIKNPEVLLVLLNTITNIIEAAVKSNQLRSVCTIIEEIGGFEKIEQLQDHRNLNVYKSALNIVEYFHHNENILYEEEEDNDAEDSSLSPTNEDGTFGFDRKADSLEGGFSF